MAAEIISILPPAKHFYDIFGGGGAMTHAAALHWQERARVAREQGDSDRERAYLLLMALTFQITEKREQWRVRHACIC